MKQSKCLQLVVLLISTCFACSGDKKEERENSRIENVQALLEQAKHKDFSPSERIQFIDSAYSLPSSNVTDSLSLAIIYAKSNAHYDLNQQDSTFYYDNHLRVKAKKVSNDYFLGRAYANLAFYYRNKEKSDSAYYYFNQSKNHFENLGDSVQAGRKLIGMGIIQQAHGDYFGSKETLTQALAFLEPKKDLRYIASAYNEMATANRKLLNHTDAIAYFKKAIQLTTSKKAKSTFTNNLAAVLIDDGQFLAAENLLQSLMADASLVKNPSSYARVIDNLAYARWHSGTSNALQQFRKALQIRKKEKDKRGQIASYTHLGEYFSKTNPKNAQQYLDTVRVLSKELKIPKAEQDALKFLLPLQPKNVQIRDRYVFLRDSLYEQELKVKTQFAKMKYDDELSQKAILSLEAETSKQQTQLANARFQKAIYLSLGSFIILGSGVFFYFLKQRHKKEKLQEVYATEKRISKKVHDELANDIYGVMSYIGHSKAFKKEETLDTLEEIYNRTRDISHETSAIDIQNYIEELKKLLSQFRNNDTIIAVKGLSDMKWQSIADEKKIILYRVLNELLVNMKKHSEATLVSFVFESSKEGIKVDYKDNGKGVKLPLEKGVGLANTVNRIKNIEGTFSFVSELGKGVVITFSFPI